MPCGRDCFASSSTTFPTRYREALLPNLLLQTDHSGEFAELIHEIALFIKLFDAGYRRRKAIKRDIENDDLAVVEIQ
jgi:hypothetical protein